ncbi:hypothetical protein P154DRAFT_605287 [Amniculicola lignicola CBS 123094]|uniref:Rhodopsin domain-containing protein n=1 Tax=Amniculicola lignicola CBS 123094 TaxID=1392246 RepID=A0A6A5W6Q9_9PLEO|nr:hypothetical protein P154DRAFT_605287 [Amniculicola lignicola CBS 123094]
MRGIEFWVFIPVAYFSLLTIIIAFMISVDIGLIGRHIQFHLLTNPARLHTFGKYMKTVEYCYTIAFTFPKLAILCLYLRIFNISRSYRLAIYFTGAVLVATCVAGLLDSTFICRPFAYNWDKSIKGGKCGEVHKTYRYSIANIITDVMLMALPMPAIWKLRVDPATKASLFITFTVGSLGIITSIIRLTEFLRANKSHDPTFNSIHPAIWTVVEPGVYLITACLPSLQPLKRLIFKDVSLSKVVVSRLEHRSWIGSSRGRMAGSQPLHSDVDIEKPEDCRESRVKGPLVVGSKDEIGFHLAQFHFEEHEVKRAVSRCA